METAHSYVCLDESNQELRGILGFEVYYDKPSILKDQNDLEAEKKLEKRSRFKEIFTWKNACSFFRWISKKAIFITSVPFYWFIIFQYVVGWFEVNFFIFVVCASIVMSFIGGGWGILNSIGVN